MWPLGGREGGGVPGGEDGGKLTRAEEEVETGGSRDSVLFLGE